MRMLFLLVLYGAFGFVWGVLMILFFPHTADPRIMVGTGIVVFGLVGLGVCVWEQASGDTGLIGLMPLVKAIGLMK